MTDGYRTTSTETLLRRVALARAGGDWTAARSEWEACIARARERVENVVDRYVAKGWIPAGEHEDVVQEALVRGARALVENLDSLSEDAFFAAMVRCADYQCRDDARRVLRRSTVEKPLDAPAGWSDEQPVARYAREEAQAAADAWGREEELRAIGRVLDDAIGRLRDPRARKLVLLQRLGVPDAAIAEELGTSVMNVHTIRSRALRELRGLIDS